MKEMNDIAIKVNNLTKTYKLYNSHQDRMLEALHPLRKKFHTEFNALKDINLEIKKGEVVGLVGENGAGKSTLLKIVTGVLTPSSGTFEVNGKISALLELGTGFNPEYTGIQNIYFRSTLMGYTKSQVDEMVDDIINFADIGEYIHQPVKTYSSGMFVRLAFAVAVNVNPDILIIDEALSVGDAFFGAKSMKRINQFKEEGKTVLFVSHDQSSIINLCTRAVLIENGRISEIGIPKEIIKIYNNKIYKKLNESHIVDTKNKVNKQSIEQVKTVQTEENNDFITDKIKLLSYKLLNNANEEIKFINLGEILKIQFEIQSEQNFDDIRFGFSIRDKLGAVVFGSNSYLLKKKYSIQQGDIAKVTFNVPVQFSEGIYSVAISAASSSFHINSSNEVLMFKYEVMDFKVNRGVDIPYYEGYIYINAMVEVE